MSAILAETHPDQATTIVGASHHQRNQVATAVLSPAEIAAPIRQLEVKQRNLSVLLAEVTGIDVASRTIEASSPGVGYWAAHYINRDGSWSVARDALGRIIRCETEKLALSVARYRRRRLQQLPLSSPDTSPL
jgi:hypothetical protein